jgi:hypothetical protein
VSVRAVGPHNMRDINDGTPSCAEAPASCFT